MEVRSGSFCVFWGNGARPSASASLLGGLPKCCCDCNLKGQSNVCHMYSPFEPVGVSLFFSSSFARSVRTRLLCRGVENKKRFSIRQGRRAERALEFREAAELCSCFQCSLPSPSPTRAQHTYTLCGPDGRESILEGVADTTTARSCFFVTVEE